MSEPLKDRIALVTGASRGIGAALALELAKAGAHVIAVARTVGGLEELDDKIKAAGGTATLVPLDMKDMDGIARLAPALARAIRPPRCSGRQCRQLATPSPLGHVEPKSWDDVMAVNVTANWHLIRAMDPLLQSPTPAARCSSRPGSPPWRAPYFGLYAASKAALDALARTYAAEMREHQSAGEPVQPRPDAHAHDPTALPGIDPETLPTPEEVAKTIVPLCLPDCTESGKVYDFRSGKFLEFKPPA